MQETKKSNKIHTYMHTLNISNTIHVYITIHLHSTDLLYVIRF